MRSSTSTRACTHGCHDVGERVRRHLNPETPSTTVLRAGLHLVIFPAGKVFKIRNRILQCREELCPVTEQWVKYPPSTTYND